MRVLAVVLLCLVTACSSAETSAPPPTGRFKVEQLAAGLEHGWDVGFLPDGRLLVPQRPGRLALIDAGKVSTVDADFGDVLVAGEGGLMGLVVHPDFAATGEFTTCQTHRDPDDVRLVTWKLDGTRATRVRDLLTGLPVNPSGRHSGCRPALAADGALLVGTGDTARPSISQDRRSLGGKVLRIDLHTGNPLPGNPFLGSADTDPRILSYGHRNVQGVAVRDGGQVFTAEHGPAFDDEVNLIKPGANYGWDPSKGGTSADYDESVPMTDTSRFPDAVPAVWSTGKLTEAICAADFLRGKQWGAMEGKLAVVALKGQKMLLLGLDPTGVLVDVTLPPEFDDKFGRLRAVRSGPDGALYVTTSDGTDDKLLKVTPA
ncbi:PQQ-dependent sugar dehydrogenase [Amycolatopsis sp. NPDC059657]|uniref:PQQ-dependent sugar dehydrogenase n=1 Tax=Amycolatopsis sp. NPDC059657 TaxID=3346899 RepID=UPI00366AFC41